MYAKLLLICAMLTFTGCGFNYVQVGENKVVQFYIAQDKHYKKIAFNPETKQFELEGIESETAAIVAEAIRAGLGVR